MTPKMERIASFCVNHDRLTEGLYVSRIDKDVITYDVRMKRPNAGDYLSTGEAHTIEHLFATYVRNSRYKDSVVYCGPMGCRTGFYLLLRDTVGKKEAIALVREAMAFIACFDGPIPGATRPECGNYLDQDLESARRTASKMAAILEDWTEEKLAYEM